MAFPTALTTRVLIAANGIEGPDYYQAGDSLLKPGMVCMEDDADEVKVCITTGIPLGIVGCDADHDLGTVYTVGERIPVWLLGTGVDIYIRSKDAGTQTITKNSIMVTADDTTLKGHTMVKDAHIVMTTANAQTAGTTRNLTTFFWLGRSLETGSILTDTVMYVPVKLST